MGQWGTILRTTNGGEAWISQSAPVGRWQSIYGVCFTDPHTGTAVGSNGMIICTTNGGVTFVEPSTATEELTKHMLLQNYPNPFNPSTTIKYGLPRRAHDMLTVYNTLGQCVAVLVDKSQEAGYHEVVFQNPGLASGVYLYRMQADGFVSTKKLLVLK